MEIKLLPDNWESCIINLIEVQEEQLLDPRRTYFGYLMTVNGNDIMPTFEKVWIRTVSFFVRRGGHLLYNGYLQIGEEEEQECVISPPRTHGSVMIFNQQHFSGQKIDS